VSQLNKTICGSCETFSVQFASEPWRRQSCICVDDTERQKYSRNNRQKHDDSRGARADPVFVVG